MTDGARRVVYAERAAARRGNWVAEKGVPDVGGLTGFRALRDLRGRSPFEPYRR